MADALKIASCLVCVVVSIASAAPTAVKLREYMHTDIMVVNYKTKQYAVAASRRLLRAPKRTKRFGFVEIRGRFSAESADVE